MDRLAAACRKWRSERREARISAGAYERPPRPRTYPGFRRVARCAVLHVAQFAVVTTCGGSGPETRSRMWQVAWVLLLKLADAFRLLTGEVKPESPSPHVTRSVRGRRGYPVQLCAVRCCDPYILPPPWMGPTDSPRPSLSSSSSFLPARRESHSRCTPITAQTPHATSAYVRSNMAAARRNWGGSSSTTPRHDTRTWVRDGPSPRPCRTAACAPAASSACASPDARAPTLETQT